MERFWNIVHYFAYRADCKLTYYFYKYTGAFKLGEIPYLKKRLKEGGSKDFETELMKVWERHDYGLSTVLAGGLMYGLPVIFVMGLTFLFIVLSTHKPESFQPVLVIIILSSIVSFVFNYKVLFKHDKYMEYFKEFDSKPREWRVKWKGISALTILFPFIVFALCFIVSAQ